MTCWTLGSLEPDAQTSNQRTTSTPTETTESNR
jgi:hypothetical protein